MWTYPPTTREAVEGRMSVRGVKADLPCFNGLTAGIVRAPLPSMTLPKFEEPVVWDPMSHERERCNELTGFLDGEARR